MSQIYIYFPIFYTHCTWCPGGDGLSLAASWSSSGHDLALVTASGLYQVSPGPSRSEDTNKAISVASAKCTAAFHFLRRNMCWLLQVRPPRLAPVLVAASAGGTVVAAPSARYNQGIWRSADTLWWEPATAATAATTTTAAVPRLAFVSFTSSSSSSSSSAVAGVEVHVATLAGAEGDGEGVESVELVASSTEPG